MNSPIDLKAWLHRDISRLDKLLAVLATFEEPCQVRKIVLRAAEGGMRVPKNWNISDILGRSRGLAVRTSDGWEITTAGLNNLRELGVLSPNAAALDIAASLRSELSKIKGSTTRAFVSEAIKCYESNLYRSAIVMSWLAAVQVLQKYVVTHHLDSFNAEARRVNMRWKNARTTDDIGLMREAEFLDRMSAISIIGKNVKAELKACLDRRNSCGHPNSLRIGPNTVTHHIEVLVLNVFEPFSR